VGQQEVFEGCMGLAVVVMVPLEGNETFHVEQMQCQLR
jgi:hypothetical protein